MLKWSKMFDPKASSSSLQIPSNPEPRHPKSTRPTCPNACCISGASTATAAFQVDQADMSHQSQRISPKENPSQEVEKDNIYNSKGCKK